MLLEFLAKVGYKVLIRLVRLYGGGALRGCHFGSDSPCQK